MIHRLMLLLAVLHLPLGAQDDAGEAPLQQLEERWQEAYFGARPAALLHDPQGLMRGPQAREQREFLEYHSADSLIDLCVLVFAADQLPPAGAAEEFTRGWFADGKPTVVAMYFMGSPQRAEIHLSPRLEEVVPEAERARALESAIERALTEQSPYEQMEKFALQMAIRIYRMERLLEEGTAGPAPVVDGSPSRVIPSQGVDISRFRQVFGFWREWLWHLLGTLALASFGWWWILRSQRRARHLFPDWDYEQRLGGPHGAGTGALISFSRSSPPPAAQRETLRLH